MMSGSASGQMAIIQTLTLTLPGHWLPTTAVGAGSASAAGSGGLDSGLLCTGLGWLGLVARAGSGSIRTLTGFLLAGSALPLATIITLTMKYMALAAWIWLCTACLAVAWPWLARPRICIRPVGAITQQSNPDHEMG
ncbi:hypothetical protein BDV09DRAFT_201609 [Aspergillus tetrazonus]